MIQVLSSAQASDSKPVMQETFSASQNLYADWVSMELEASPSNASSQKQFDLYLTLQFNEQWQALLNGRIKFGFKGAQLRLKSEGAIAEWGDPDLGNPFAVTTSASAEEIIWRFCLKTSDSAFRGSLERIRLGSVTLTDEPYQLTATLSVTPPDISVTDGEGLWRHDISPNKHAVLERKLALFLFETQFQSYLSRVELGSQLSENAGDRKDKIENAIAPASLSQLEASMQAIHDATTQNCKELAKLAGLNLLQDLAGGNFLATDLSAIELMGANLSRSNFRGAVLTDASLAEANLSYAKFRGADLSGAYLGNANLRYADLHRASLALTNLIGADLTEANLEEANLSNANLSGAKVDKARFGDNPGLDRETSQNLCERGAIFS